MKLSDVTYKDTLESGPEDEIDTIEEGIETVHTLALKLTITLGTQTHTCTNETAAKATTRT